MGLGCSRGGGERPSTARQLHLHQPGVRDAVVVPIPEPPHPSPPHGWPRPAPPPSTPPRPIRARRRWALQGACSQAPEGCSTSRRAPQLLLPGGGMKLRAVNSWTLRGPFSVCRYHQAAPQTGEGCLGALLTTSLRAGFRAQDSYPLEVSRRPLHFPKRSGSTHLQHRRKEKSLPRYRTPVSQSR